jgi:hypothetical protein
MIIQAVVSAPEMVNLENKPIAIGGSGQNHLAKYGKAYGIGVKIGKQWRVRPELWERVMSGEALVNISQR